MLTCASSDAVVGFERSVYYRERAAAMYSSFPYSAAQAIVEVTPLTVFCILSKMWAASVGSWMTHADMVKC